MPIGMNEAFLKRGQIAGGGGVCGVIVGTKQVLDEHGEFGVVAGETVMGAERRADGAKSGSDGRCVVVIAARNQHRRWGFELFGSLVEAGQHFAGVEGFVGCAFVGMAGDELEEFVDPVTKLNEGAISVARRCQGGQREARGCEVQLDPVDQADAVGLGSTGRATFEQELAAFGDDADFGASAGAARELGDRFDDAEVVVRQHYGDLTGVEGGSFAWFQAEARRWVW